MVADLRLLLPNTQCRNFGVSSVVPAYYGRNTHLRPEGENGKEKVPDTDNFRNSELAARTVASSSGRSRPCLLSWFEDFQRAA